MHASLRQYKSKVSFKLGEGIPPDFEIDEDIDDIVIGKDTQLEFALDKLRSEP
jgi:hypothetical protein